MIRVTLELIPGGFGPPELLGRIDIDNQVHRTLSDHRRGDYRYRLFKKRTGKVWKEGMIEDFPRLSYHTWNLVRKILNDAAAGRGVI